MSAALEPSLEDEYEQAVMRSAEHGNLERTLIFQAWNDLEYFHLLSKLRPADFVDYAARAAYAALKQTFREVEDVSMLQVISILGSSDNREDRNAGEMMRDSFLAEKFHVVSLREYQVLIRHVGKLAYQRRLQDAGQQMIRLSKRQDLTVNDMHDRSANLVNMASAGYTDKKLMFSESEILREYADNMQAQLNAPSSTGGRKVPLGFPELDELLGGGLAPGQVLGLLARSGMGKSILGLQMARNSARSVKTGWFSFEMKRHELSARITAQDMQRPPRLIKPSEVYSLAELRARNLWFDDQTYKSVDALWRQIKMVKMLHPDMQNIGIDYAQQLALKETGPQSEVSDKLKKIAMEEGLGIIALLQAPPDLDKLKDTQPYASDIRWCKSYEQDFDLICALWRPGFYFESADPAAAYLFVRKNRDGPKGEVKLSWSGELLSFTSRRTVTQEDVQAVNDMPTLF